MSDHDLPTDSPTPTWKKVTAVIGILVPLCGAFGAGAYKLVEFGKVQATVELQHQVIADYKEKNRKIEEQNEKLTGTVRTLELELATVKTKLGNVEERATLTTSQLNEYKSVAAQLSDKLAKNDPCSLIQHTIAELEEELARNDYFGLKGERRIEKQAQVDQHQASLRACLGKAS